MELRALGSTGIMVSPLGLGTVKIGRNQQVKYPTGFAIPDDTQVSELLTTTWELGINILDTAPAYGNSEERLGQLLPHRHDWVIVGKVGEIFENGESRFDFSADYTRQSVERSLRRLRRDVIDVMLVHSHGDDMSIIHNEAVCDTLQELKHRGLVKAIGMSTKTVEGGLWCVENMDVVMATYNMEYQDELPVLERAAVKHKSVLIKKGLQSGHSTDARAALSYVLQQQSVSSIIVGTIQKTHLIANVRAVELAMESKITPTKIGKGEG